MHFKILSLLIPELSFLKDAYRLNFRLKSPKSTSPLSYQLVNEKLTPIFLRLHTSPRCSDQHNEILSLKLFSLIFYEQKVRKISLCNGIYANFI